MRDRWNGKELRRRRRAQKLTVEELALKAGVNEKTIRNIENGTSTFAKQETVFALAAYFQCEAHELLAANTISRPVLEQVEPDSELAALVREELRFGPPRILRDEREDLVELTPRGLQDVFTMYKLHENRSFWLSGVIVDQRGVSEEEAFVLGTESGASARFLIVKETPSGRLLRVTVYVPFGALAAELQRHLSGDAILLAVRVAVVPRTIFENRPPQLLTPSGAPWRGFSVFGSDKPRPWTFLADRLIRRAPSTDVLEELVP